MRHRLRNLHDRLEYLLRPRPVVPIRPTASDYVRSAVRGSLGWLALAFLRLLLWMFG